MSSNDCCSAVRSQLVSGKEEVVIYAPCAAQRTWHIKLYGLHSRLYRTTTSTSQFHPEAILPDIHKESQVLPDEHLHFGEQA